ncbi:MAG TPA: N-acetylmuramoyl-L-alanine amidase [Thermoanaerobaculia bacterium]|nr:N-acetylmuramoyl-L-alanine amidase [Thermoanaerobaculia bacterium]
MVSSRGVNKAAALCLSLLGVALAFRLAAVEKAPPPLPVLHSGSAQVTVDGRDGEILYAITEKGPLFGLTPLTVLLGGEVASDPAGRAFTLTVGETELVFGPESESVVISGAPPEEAVLALSQRPQAASFGLLVPLDLLEISYGRVSGLAFRWDPDERRLAVSRPPANEVAVAAEVVHLSGATTVVLTFRDQPARYRVVAGEGWMDVQVPGGSFRLTGGEAAASDPLARGIEAEPGRLRLRLAPEVRASHYTLDEPFRIVFDLAATGEGATSLGAQRGAGGLTTIVIDPGHGGTETGAIGKGGAVEKELALALALALERRLEAELPGVRVVLTRTEDLLLPLAERAAIANQNKADLFISIHLNSSAGGRPTGAETYFLSLQASDRLAAAAAERENPPGGGTDGADSEESALALILWELAQAEHLAESQRFAGLVQAELNQALGLKDRGVKQAPFSVLMGAAMPAVLVELGFLSNPEEEARLKEEPYREQLVTAVARAVARYQATREPAPLAEARP